MPKTFFLSVVLFPVFDFIWLGLVMKDFNLRQLAPIGRIENGAFALLLWPAGLAYLCMALSVTLFAFPRAAASSSGIEAFLWGAALGLCVYGIYDTTNLAILKSYPLPFAFADIAWGTLLFGVVTWITGWVSR